MVTVFGNYLNTVFQCSSLAHVESRGWFVYTFHCAGESPYLVVGLAVAHCCQIAFGEAMRVTEGREAVPSQGGRMQDEPFESFWSEGPANQRSCLQLTICSYIKVIHV